MDLKILKQEAEKILQNMVPQEHGQLMRQFSDHFLINFYENLDAGCVAYLAHQMYLFMQNYDRDGPFTQVSNPLLHENNFVGDKFTVIQTLNRDMSFLVDSITEEIKSLGLIVYHRVNLVVSSQRDNGKLVSVSAPEITPNTKVSDSGVINESLMCFLITRVEDEKAAMIKEKINALIAKLMICVADWPVILDCVSKIRQEMISNGNALFSKEDVNESAQLISWLAESNFVFLGFAQFFYEGGKIIPGGQPPLGMFSFVDYKDHFSDSVCLDSYQYPVYVTRSKSVSQVHRRVNLDLFRIPILSGARIVGEAVIIGLFTANAYFQDVTKIPVIRKKVDELVREASFPPRGHSIKALMAILQGFPKTELFHIPSSLLLTCCIDIMSLAMHPRLKLFVFYDRISSYIRCIVFLPRKNFSIPVWQTMQKMIAGYFDAKVLDENVRGSSLLRLQVILSAKEGFEEKESVELEEQLSFLLIGWYERLRQVLLTELGVSKAETIMQRYLDAFSEGYKHVFNANDALYDVTNLEKLALGSVSADLYIQDGEYQLKVYMGDKQLNLSDMIPVIENMGMQVVGHNSYKIFPSDGRKFWIHNFHLKVVGTMFLEINEIKAQFEDTLALVWRGKVENDYYNSLVILAGLQSQEVVLLRAWGKYLQQVRFRYSQDQIKRTLSSYPELVSCLIQLFHSRFDPHVQEKQDKQRQTHLISKIEKLLQRVESLVDDIIIRRILNLILSTLRTNYYLAKDYVSFKFNSQNISNLPLPCPYAEIYVYSTQFEAIHLRGGKVARGGLRWSDRFEDFRTEVLGLLKAQMPKNTVIVPTGSKGGFVVKIPAGDDPDAYKQMVVGCYQNFLRAMLDITDNVINGAQVRPGAVVCYDDFDPYLVIAADKGTATFSDYANAVSAEYQFWLGDAFASGGSSGYDHKAMGITARGAWVAVERHFWEMRKNIHSEPFTAIGIGDMSGDVFGNGMLLSDKIQLVAAFNHLHIFLDPNPEPVASFKERARLFANPGLSWNDYTRELISAGGGVFPRKAKSIVLSDAVKERFGILSRVKEMSPDDLIRLILKSKVDLIWNGGIGTFIMSSSETNEMVGDKANDNIRVFGKELNASVFAEGGNLGLTQLGRIEFATKGGRINTDFIDNSAGVSCSDMEVNIKIALASAMEKGKLSLEDRNILLSEMRNEVGTMILRKYNDLQTKSLTVQSLQASHNRLEQYQRLMSRLEKVGLLNRKVEFLPSDEEMTRMAAEKRGLTRPQLAVLTAYAKMHFNSIIMNSDLLNHEYFSQYLIQYFPSMMQQIYREEILSHPLRKEIIATYITNSIIHRMGCTFVDSVVENTGLPEPEVVRIYMAVREAYELRALWSQIDVLDGRVNLDTYIQMIDELHNFVRQTTEWFFRNYPKPVNIVLAIEEFKNEARNIASSLSSILDPESLQSYAAKVDCWTKGNVPEKLAVSIASLAFLGSSLAITQITSSLRFHGKLQVPSFTVGKIYFHLGNVLHLSWLREASLVLESGSYWNRVSVRSLSDDIYDKQMLITAEVCKYITDGNDDYMRAIEAWSQRNSEVLDRYNTFISELKSSDTLDLSKLIVIIRRLGNIC